MVSLEAVRRRLNKFEEYLALLERIRGYSQEEFIADQERYGSAEWFLQLAIEALTDLGNYVIAERQLGVVDLGSDIPAIFHQQGHVEDELRQRWVRMLGFRNVLVREYLDIHRKIVHEVLQHQLGDLRSLARVFARYL